MRSVCICAVNWGEGGRVWEGDLCIASLRRRRRLFGSVPVLLAESNYDADWTSPSGGRFSQTNLDNNEEAAAGLPSNHS